MCARARAPTLWESAAFIHKLIHGTGTLYAQRMTQQVTLMPIGALAMCAVAAYVALYMLRREHRAERELPGPTSFGPQLKDAVVVIDPDLAKCIPAIQGEFRHQAQRMPRLVRRLLLEDVDPLNVSPDELIAELHLPPEAAAAARDGLSRRSVLSWPALLPPAACARLRSAVDADRQQKCDTVDGAPDEQLNLSVDRLDALISDAAASAALRELPALFAAYDSTPTRAALALDGAEVEVFVRRYAAETRPWNPFHTDSSALTLNVALNDDSDYSGGDLLACHDGAIHRLPRREGDATVHAASLLHGVSMMRRGVRYALIIFMGRAASPTAVTATGAEMDLHAEALALALLMQDADALGHCNDVCGAATVVGMRTAYEQLQALPTHEVGRLLEWVVLHYGAPHLQPTRIHAQMKAQAAACWSLNALLRYATDAPASTPLESSSFSL